ncbi:MAG: hypothetical protein V8T87_01290 [Victivallales bacterium]
MLARKYNVIIPEPKRRHYTREDKGGWNRRLAISGSAYFSCTRSWLRGTGRIW